MHRPACNACSQKSSAGTHGTSVTLVLSRFCTSIGSAHKETCCTVPCRDQAAICFEPKGSVRAQLVPVECHVRGRVTPTRIRYWKSIEFFSHIIKRVGHEVDKAFHERSEQMALTKHFTPGSRSGTTSCSALCCSASSKKTNLLESDPQGSENLSKVIVMLLCYKKTPSK